MPARKLTPQAVVTTALALADRHGLEALTMRGLATGLGVEAMSLYHHFASKDALPTPWSTGCAAILLPEASGQWRGVAPSIGLGPTGPPRPPPGRFR